MKTLWWEVVFRIKVWFQNQMEHLLWDASSWNKFRCRQRWRGLKKSVWFWAYLESSGTSFYLAELTRWLWYRPAFVWVLGDSFIVCIFYSSLVWMHYGQKEGTGRKTTWASSIHLEWRHTLYKPAQTGSHVQSNEHRNVHEYSSKRSKGELCEKCSSRFRITSYWSSASTVAPGRLLSAWQLQKCGSGCEQPGPLIVFPKCSEENPSSLLQDLISALFSDLTFYHLPSHTPFPATLTCFMFL